MGSVIVTSLLHYIASKRWQLQARPKQLPPPGNDWFVWLIRTGRGWGKSRALTEWLDQKARTKAPGSQMLLAGRTPSDVRDYELQGPGGLLTNHPDIEYFPSKRMLLWPNGVEGLIRSGANPEEFRGFSGDTACLSEFAAWDYSEESWNNLIFGMREGNPQIAIGTTPKPISILRRIAAMSTTVLITGSSYENADNLSAKYVSAVLDPISGTSLGRREIEGLDTDDAEGALWKRNLINDNRVSPGLLSGPGAPELSMVAVGVDPQGKKGLQDDQHDRETGIVAVALCLDNSAWHGHYFVLDDTSINGTPNEWGSAVVGCYKRNQADLVIAEINFGGEMVDSTISVIDPNVPTKLVTASRGKVRRAAPVVALYEQGKVHHVGVHTILEDEMCNWVHKEGKNWSPNRMDGLVWAITDLREAELSMG